MMDTKHSALARMLLAALLGLLISPSPSRAEDPFASPERVETFAEELEFFKVESDVVTSVSRNPESLWGAAAAVYVVTSDDIESSGARTIPDALRMVPGLDVAAVDYNLSAISARGFNNTFADKMLVLLDGRPIYTPEFGGTFWHQWNTFLPDIDRIEVIRGPGGTLWGSNAVNGVINIITKSSEDTHGLLVRGEVGDNNLYTGEARWGGEVGRFNYRMYGRQNTTDGYGGDGGDDIFDENDETRAGYRFDWDLGEGLNFSGSGELYNGRFGSMNYLPVIPDPLTYMPVDYGRKFKTDMYTGVFKLAKDFASGSHAYFQVALTYADREIPFLGLLPNPAIGVAADPLSSTRRSSDIELAHNFRPHRDHRVTWGLTYHRTSMDINDSEIVSFRFQDGDDETLDLAGGFIQDQVRLWPGGELTIGTKVEWNTFTDWNVQPSIRLAHRFNEETTLWGSISRAVNIPSFGDNFVELRLPPDTTSIPGVTVVPKFLGSESVDDTDLLAYEIGLRHRFNSQVSLDVATFFNDYSNFAGWSGTVPATIGPDPDAPLDPTRLVATTTIDNRRGAQAYGAEAVFGFIVNDRVRAELNGSWQMLRHLGNDNPQVPEWKINFRPRFQLSEKLQLVPSIHWVDKVLTPIPLSPTSGTSRTEAYLRADVALNYEPSPRWPKISFVWQNATKEAHIEANELLVRPIPAEITRAWYVRLTQEF
jgi:iron complex outermembrane receptor protein